MATYKGRTYTSSCRECGTVFPATHQFKADNQADACYDTHYPKPTRDTKVVMDELKEMHPDVWEE